jgi:hypothetical protein
MAGTTDIARPRFARGYPKAAARADRRGAAGHRRRLLEGLRGRVVEIGAGDGRNFAHCPAAVSEVIAVEPEPALRELAARAARDAPVPITVREGTADALPPGVGVRAARALPPRHRAPRLDSAGPAGRLAGADDRRPGVLVDTVCLDDLDVGQPGVGQMGRVLVAGEGAGDAAGEGGHVGAGGGVHFGVARARSSISSGMSSP